MIIKKELVMHR